MLHERLRVAREKAEGLSQRELSRLAGVAEGAVWFIETQPDRRTDAWLLDRVASVLGVSLDWLVRGIGPEPTADAIREAVAAARVRVATGGEAA
jgi:transcriptional regulator with XRE-family HTH domain